MTTTRVEYQVRHPVSLTDPGAGDQARPCKDEDELADWVRYLRSRAEQAGVELRIETYQRTVTVGEWEPMDVPTPI